MNFKKNISYKILFSDIADQEISQAIEYHQANSEVGEYNFKTQLNRILDTLETNPFFQIKYKNIRAVPFKSLPYLVIFEINEQEKII